MALAIVVVLVAARGLYRLPRPRHPARAAGGGGRHGYGRHRAVDIGLSGAVPDGFPTPSRVWLRYATLIVPLMLSWPEPQKMSHRKV